MTFIQMGGPPGGVEADLLVRRCRPPLRPPIPPLDGRAKPVRPATAHDARPRGAQRLPCPVAGRATFVVATLSAILVMNVDHPAAAAPRLEEEEIEMQVGDQRRLPAKEIEKYSPGPPGIVKDVRSEDGSELILVALAPGTTTLLVLMRNGRQIHYTISVRPREAIGTVKARPNIRLDFYFVQLSGSGTYRVGVGWPGTIGGTSQIQVAWDLGTGQRTAASASLAAQALPRIDLAQGRGWVRVLRQASLVVANGDQGTFSTSTELNFIVEGNLSTGIEKIQAGSEVRVRPRYDSKSGRSEIQLSADVSEFTEGAASVPGRAVSKVETVVNLEHGQAVILAGLQARTASQTRAGLPLLSQIPVLGALFGSHAGRNEQSENLIFIVPTVAESIPAGKRDLVEEAFRAYRNFSGETGALQKALDSSSQP